MATLRRLPCRWGRLRCSVVTPCCMHFRARALAGRQVIQKKRAEKPEQRQASREAALREIKERAKKAKQVMAQRPLGSCS